MRAGLKAPQEGFPTMNIVAHAQELAGKLPVSYEQARAVLSSCARVDECKEWADKAAALASYARQADDKTLLKYAVRIQSRAIKRAGQLLKQYDGRGGDRTKTAGSDGSALPPSQRQAAADADMSERQQLTAVRVASIPDELFDAQVESDNPPTVTDLAEQGKKSAPKAEAPPGFAEATKFIGEIERLHAFLTDAHPDLILGGMRQFEIESAKPIAAALVEWLQQFIAQTGGVADVVP
jgi:hypothetical protein